MHIDQSCKHAHTHTSKGFTTKHTHTHTRASRLKIDYPDLGVGATTLGTDSQREMKQMIQVHPIEEPQHPTMQPTEYRQHKHTMQAPAEELQNLTMQPREYVQRKQMMRAPPAKELQQLTLQTTRRRINNPTSCECKNCTAVTPVISNGL